MKIIDKQASQLENRFGTGDGKPRILLAVCYAGRQHEIDWQIDILDKHGLLPTGPLGLICLAGIPRGLDAEETQLYFPENGAVLQGVRSLIQAD
jgi:hypothetical protein